MRLKRIELAGFKSFVDPTKIDLDQGITAIVGPNGCGKSNIVDALRWVLGEHSARHLRGGVMDDLIFQGSDSRAPVAICDVELTFSIEKGSLSTPYHEMNEIRIRRRLTREGGSDAFINGKMVRLKDVVDLFLDTGISTRAYAIIEQGSIARMVTAKPEELRVIFEEAAGVMKYRSRRREAARRMKDTRQNLDRVLDLLEEVRSQCRSLKQQASRAARFKLLQDEFSRLQSLSLGLRYRTLQEHYQDIAQQLSKARTEEAEAAQQLAACEKSVSQARAKLIEHEDEAQRVQDALRTAERQRADLQQQAERMSGERRLLNERKDALHGRIHETTAHQQRLAADLDSVTQQLADQDDAALQASRQQSADAVEAATSHYHAQSNRRDRLLAEFERLKHGNEQALAQRQKAEQGLNRLEQRELQLTARLADLTDQFSQQTKQAQIATQQKTQAQHTRQSSSLALTRAQSELDRCRQERESCAQTFTTQESAVRELNGMAQELRGRSKNQDVPDELRDALRAKGGLWMDESLHVPEGLEAAVAAALRGRSADIYIADTADLQPLLDQTGDAPVALFDASQAQTAVELLGTPESLARAIGIDAKHSLYAVFAPIQLVDNIVDATATSHACVSRDGWRREPHGWLIPPSGNRTARRLAVQRTLRNTEASIIEAEAALQNAKQQFEAAEQGLEQQQQTWQQTHVRATQADSESHAADAAVLRLQAEVVALQEHQQRVKHDLTELAEERQHWQKQAADVSDMERLASLQQQAEAHLQGQREVLIQADQTLNIARQHQAQADQALALFAQARDNLLRQSERLALENARLSAQVETDQQRLQQAEGALRQAQNQHDLDQQLVRSVATVEAAHQAMNAIRSTGHALQQVQHETERGERQARQVLQLITGKHQRLEVEQAQHATRLQDTAVAIEQRCQITAVQLLQNIAAMAEVEDSGIENTETVMQRAATLEERINRFGPVNLLAIEEFDQASEREGFLARQVADLEASLGTLEATIARIDRTTKQRFKEVFDQTNVHFKQTFPQLFGGGRAELKLDSDDILTAGVEVMAQPPGKRLQDITLLSGGEKALTAVALVFSIFKIKPAPFCVLDEVDAPLDDANVVRFGEMVRELSDRVQFLTISHNKITMQQADRLIGVSMPEPGVSKIVSVDMTKVAH